MLLDKKQDWSLVEVQGRIGSVPTSYLEELRSDSTSSKVAQKKCLQSSHKAASESKLATKRLSTPARLMQATKSLLTRHSTRSNAKKTDCKTLDLLRSSWHNMDAITTIPSAGMRTSPIFDRDSQGPRSLSKSW